MNRPALFQNFICGRQALKRKSFSFCAVLSLALVLTGCFQKRIFWSPDGKVAAVLADNGLYLCDGEGHLSPRLAEAILSAGWLPDSKGLVLVGEERFEQWSALAKRLNPTTRSSLEQWAARAQADLEHGGAWNEVFKNVKEQFVLEDNEVAAVKLYLRDTPLASLQTLNLSEREDLKRMKVDLAFIQLAEVDFPGLKLGRIIADGYLVSMQEPLASPTGRAVAFVTFQDRRQLFVVPADGSAPPTQVEESTVAQFPDWTPDGRSLVYVRSASKAADRELLALGILGRRQVLDDAGHIGIKDKPEDLAGLFFDGTSRVRCLKDGRILFSSTEFNLPLTEKEVPQRQQIFFLDPARVATTGRLLPQSVLSQLPDDLTFFEVSPDEKQIAFVDDKGRVFLFTIASGELKTVQDRKGDTTGTTPVWRFPDQLCFVNIPEPGSERKQEVVLRGSTGGILTLSENWPEDARKGILKD
jgi:WD40-like Beta Propeller Repeat